MNTFKNIRSLAALNPYLWKYRFLLLGGIFFVIISNFFAVVPAQVVRHAFDSLRISLEKSPNGLNAITTADLNYIILKYAAIIIGMAILKGLFMFFMRQTIIVMSRKIEYDLKNDIYAHLQTLSMAYYRRNNTGDLMARISEDVSRVRIYLGPAIMYSINLTTLIILTVSIMLSVSVKLTIFCLLPLPILAFSIYYVNNITFLRSTAIQNQLSRITTFVQEVFSGIRVIKSFSSEASVKRFFIEEASGYKDKALSEVRVESLWFPFILLLIGLSTIITLFVGGKLVISGSITPGVIAEFFIYVNLLSWPVASLGWTTSLIQRAAASQARINELMNELPEITYRGGKKLDLKGEILLDDICFTYPETGIKALCDISIHVKPGESLGIIGRTGSGKSTLANLILRSYDVQEGNLLIDGKNIKDIDLGIFRKQVGYVPQDDFLFSESIAENIMFGLEGGNNSQEKSRTDLLISATTAADIFKDIQSFPNGFETVLGERGITLSGGQKQRVAIARAIVKNPKMLILDDCFSAIDTNTEAQILQNLGSIMKDKTSVIISHRVSTVKNASHIIVLDAGKIIEQGTHAQLMDHQGYYYLLYRKQLMEKELYDSQKVSA